MDSSINTKYKVNTRALSPSSLEREKSFTNIGENGQAVVKPAASPHLTKLLVTAIVVGIVIIASVIVLVVVILTTKDGDGDNTTGPPITTTSMSTDQQSSTTISSLTTTGLKDGMWSLWGDWTQCTSTCDSGIHKRYRKCEGQDSNHCLGDFIETEACEEIACQVYGKWTTWGSWAMCSVSCGSGIQSRTRSCSKTDSSDIDCVGLSSQDTVCNEWECPDCSKTCLVGELNDDCDSCQCDGDVITGRVCAADTQNPVSNAALYLSSTPNKLLGQSNSTGFFTIENVCSNSELLVTRQGFVDHTIIASDAHLLINISKQVLPYLTETPQSKNRLSGDDVTFCCTAVANPPIIYYEWLKDGLILDESLYEEGNKLQLSGLSTTDSGSYQCRANSKSGAIMSQPATLNVKDMSSQYCSDALQQKTISLPDDCVQPRTNTATYDVGECISKSCRDNTTSDSGSCRENITSCCTTGEADLETVQCSGYELAVIVVKSCSCGTCRSSNTLTISGTAVGLDDGSPLRYGEVFVNGVFVTFTSNSGTFRFETSKNSSRITINILDNYFKQFLPAVKVIEIRDEMNGVLRIDIHVTQIVEPVQIDSSTASTLVAGSSASMPIIEVHVPANAFYYQDGSKYDGTVLASLTFIDPTNMSNSDNIPGILEIVDAEGQRAELASQAMFNLYFEDTSGNPLVLDTVINLFIPAETSINLEDRDIKLWGLNPETGIWEYITQGTGMRRRKKRNSSRWIGDIDWSLITYRKWLNVDYFYFSPSRCFFKIRLFQDEALLTSILNPEKFMTVSSHFLTDNGSTLRSVNHYLRYPEDECLLSKCEDDIAYITLQYYGRRGLENLFAGVPLIRQITQMFELMDNNKTLKIQMSSSSVGPFYEQKEQCISKGIDDNHLRFHYGETNNVFTHNIFFTPTRQNPMLQIPTSQRTWYPERIPEGYRVCFLKVRITIELTLTLMPGQYIKLRATSKGGSEDDTLNFIFGIREYKLKDLADTSFCVEYKCSGIIDPVFENSKVDYTHLELKLIYPEDEFSCNVTQEADYITSYSHLENTAQIGRRDGIYEIKMPKVYTPEFGLYSATSDQLDIETATNTAESECISGKPQNLNDQNPEEGVGVYFSLK